MVFKLKAKTATMLSGLLAPLWASKCGAILINITVDDTNTTAWTWVGSWHVITQNNPCPECGAQLDGNRVYNHSWHDGVLHSGSFTFQGVAVYIYGIDIEDPANITFGMSNPPISTFYYKNTGGGYIYNSIFFSADGLDGTSQHTVTWMEGLNSMGGGGAALFDYAVVTVDRAESSSPSSARPSSSLGKSSTRSSSSANIAQPSFSASSTQPSSATSSGVPSSSSPNSTSQIPSTSNSTSLTDTTHKSNLEAWPIAGGLIGAFAAFAILATVLYYCSRRRNGNKRSWRSHSRNTGPVAIEPFQLAPSTIPRNPKEPIVHPRTPSRPSPPTSPPMAPGLDTEIEQRLRNLEAMVADQRPPAYA